MDYETIRCMDLNPHAHDAEDRLAPFLERFRRGPDITAYLDGNSLGRLPAATPHAMATIVEDGWGGRLIRGWNEGWVDYPTRAGDELAAAALGAAAGQTVIADSTSVNIYKVLRSAVRMRPGRGEIVVEDTAFPTDRYLAEAIAAELGMTLRLVAADRVSGVSIDALRAQLSDQTAAVLLSHVDYRSGALLDVGSLTALTHDAGALMVCDLSHSAGVVPVQLDAWGVDFAVGCTYKYLNGGPGAPAFIYVAQRHLPYVDQPIPGWWSADDLFAMEEKHRPAGDIRRMLSGTPPILAITAVRSGVSLVEDAGIDEIRSKSIKLGDYLIALLDARVPQAQVLSPRDPGLRGSHVTIGVDDAATITGRLIEHGVVPDFRHPDLIRLGLSPLSTSFAEVSAAVGVLTEVLG